ncbi:hypothetical protein BBJ28_00017300 [Nothophytophthora sp. Chile5]|nr:hypothetical protein BBJ28_00017300 [Nothophytophthora sp. Chile5]
MDDDQWKADGSFRGMNVGGGKGKGKGKGPQFTRVIPKFLRKYHQAPSIQAKFAALPKPGEDGDDDDGELDEVQQAAMDEYLAKKQARKDAKEEEAADAEADPQGTASSGDTTDSGKKAKGKAVQSVVQMGKTGASDATKRKKRKRSDAPALSNKKLLSFSMDDE